MSFLSFPNWLHNPRSVLAPRRDPRHHGRRGPLQAASHRLNLEVLEDRTLLSFSAPVDYAVGTNSHAVVAADFNNDGRLDLATANWDGNAGVGNVSVLLGNGNGTFQAARNYDNGSAPESIVAGDFNGDGKLDLVTGDLDNDYGYIGVLLGNGNGTFQWVQEIGYDQNTTWAVAVGDFDADGKLDVAATGHSSNSFFNYVDVLQGHGDGTFAVRSTYHELSSDANRAISTGDFNGDGKLDLVWPDLGGAGAVGVLLGNGNGTFAAAAQFFATDRLPVSVAVADLNGDGKLDLVTANESGSVSVLSGNGNGTFQAARNYADGKMHTSVAVADFNGDGKRDVVTADEATGTVSLWLGNGDSTLWYAGAFIIGSSPSAVAVGDFNGDGRPDVAVADADDSGDGAIAALLNDGNWSGMPPAQQASGFNVRDFPSPTSAGQAGSLTLTALDSGGSVLTGYTGTVHFTSSDALAGLPADYTFTAADQGVHAFSATLRTAGAQSLTVAEGIAHSTQSGITVNPAAATRFTVVGFPSPVTAGAIGNFTVTALDPYGNRATGYTGTIHVGSSDARAVLPGNYTFTTADAGVHSFSATLKTAGTQAITTTDTATANINGTIGNILVTSAAACQFVIAAPASVTAGVRFSLTITVEDAYGNVVTGYTGRIHFSSADSGATLPANYTFAATDRGVHTFTGLKLKKKSKQTILVTDTLNGSLMGKSIINVL